MKKSIKLISLALVASLSVTMSSMAFADSSISSDDSAISIKKDPVVDALIEKLEKAKKNVRDEEMASYASEIESQGLKDADEMNVKKKDINEKHKKNIKDKTHKLLLENGFTLVSNSSNLQQLSDSNSISLYDTLYYNSSSQLYDFEGSWDFNDSNFDQYSDLEDFAAVRMTNDDNTKYYIYSSYSTVYNSLGFETGSCSNGSSSGSSRVTKKFQDKSGVIYNVIDADTYAATYETDKGYISQYIKKVGGGFNQIFLDYAHNYKAWALDLGGQISSVNLAGPSHTLNVTYARVSGAWQRCSGGETITQ